MYFLIRLKRVSFKIKCVLQHEHLPGNKAVFPVKFQLRGFVTLTTEKWEYKEKNGVQNRTSMDTTKLSKSHWIIMRIKILNEWIWTTLFYFLKVQSWFHMACLITLWERVKLHMTSSFFFSKNFSTHPNDEILGRSKLEVSTKDK